MGTKNQVRFLILLQVLDALFTLWGVHCLGFGLNIEGNPLMRYLMTIFGAETTLIVTKSVAMLILTTFIQDSYSLAMKLIIGFVCAIYTFVVGLWVYVYVINLWSAQC